MKGVWLENRQLELRDQLSRPVVAPGEALVKVLQAGICNTDLELLRGYYPYTGILGHEFIGVVEEGPPELLNQRVVGEINASCGKCQDCLQGRSTHCINRTVLGIVNRHGAFAEYLTLPVANLHRVPDNVSNDAATFTEPIAAALEIQQQINIVADHRVLVIGDGKLGQLVAQTLALTGCDLMVIGRHTKKLANLADKGIKTGLVASLTPRYFDIVVECTGNSEGFLIARQALRPRGILVLKSTYAGHLTLDMSSIVVDEITLIGSRCGPFDQALQLLGENVIDFGPIIDCKYPLSDALEAFSQAQKSGVLKVLLDMT